MLEILGMLAAGPQIQWKSEQNSPTPIVVILAGPRRTDYKQGLLVNCVVTGQTTDYTEVTCAD